MEEVVLVRSDLCVVVNDWREWRLICLSCWWSNLSSWMIVTSMDFVCVSRVDEIFCIPSSSMMNILTRCRLGFMRNGWSS